MGTELSLESDLQEGWGGRLGVWACTLQEDPLLSFSGSLSCSKRCPRPAVGRGPLRYHPAHSAPVCLSPHHPSHCLPSLGHSSLAGEIVSVSLPGLLEI